MKAFITMALMTVGLMLGSFPGQAQGSKPLNRPGNSGDSRV